MAKGTVSREATLTRLIEMGGPFACRMLASRVAIVPL